MLAISTMRETRRTAITEKVLVDGGWKPDSIVDGFWICPDCQQSYSKKASGRQKHWIKCKDRREKTKQKKVQCFAYVMLPA